MNLTKPAIGSTNWGTDVNNNWTTLDTALSHTAGAVPFSDGTTFVSDSTRLFWDNTNKRLGIGTNSPAEKLDVAGTIRSTGRRAAITVASGAYTATVSDEVIVQTSVNNITLPSSASAGEGRVYQIRNASGANITVVPSGSDTISPNGTIGSNSGQLIVLSGTTWYKV